MRPEMRQYQLLLRRTETYFPIDYADIQNSNNKCNDELIARRAGQTDINRVVKNVFDVTVRSPPSICSWIWLDPLSLANTSVC